MATRKSNAFASSNNYGDRAGHAVQAGAGAAKALACTGKDVVHGFLSGFFGSFKQPEAQPQRAKRVAAKPAAKRPTRVAAKPAARNTKKASAK